MIDQAGLRMANPAASAADGAWILTPPGADRRLDHALAGDNGDRLAPVPAVGADDGEPRFDGGGAQDFAALGILGEVRDDGGQRHGSCAQVDAGVGVGLTKAGTIVEISRAVWERHEDDLRESGDIFYNWQHDLRWASLKLRKADVLLPASDEERGVWRLREGYSVGVCVHSRETIL